MAANRMKDFKKNMVWLRRDWRLYVMLILPVAWYLLFCYKPMTGLVIAFQKYNIFTGIAGSDWVGLSNFEFVFDMRDFMAQPENMFPMQNGLEGIHYTTTDENGIPTDIKPIDQVPDEYKMHATDVVAISNGMNYGSVELNIAAQTLSYPEELRAAVANSLAVAGDGEYAPPTFTVAIPAEGEYDSFITAKEGEMLVKLVTCDPAQFDDIFDEYVEAILEVGAQQIFDQRLEAYQNGNIRGFYPYAK